MRTLFWYVSFFGSLIGALPKLWHADKLEKKGEADKCDAFVYKTVKKWMEGTIKRSGTTVEIIGKENLPTDQAVVYISNHQGNFDIPLLASSFNQLAGFVSKVEAKKIPFVADWMEKIHCVFLDRSDLKSAATAIFDGIKIVKEGHSLVIFPEGTRSKGDQIGEFKPASFKLATKSGAPIVPITIDGSYKIMEQNNSKIKPAHVTITVHPPVLTQNLSRAEMNALPEQIVKTIASALPQPQLEL